MMYARHEKGNIGDIHLYINAFIHIFINFDDKNDNFRNPEDGG